MKRISWAFAAVLAIGACAASTTALAEDPLGFYVGGGVGESTIRSDDPGYGLPGYYNDHQTAFQGVLGIRPLSFVGAEVEYIDFGQRQRQTTATTPTITSYFECDDSHPQVRTVLYRHGIPAASALPFLDVYGKAGVARLADAISTTYAYPSRLLQHLALQLHSVAARRWFIEPIRRIPSSPTAPACSTSCRFSGL